jgi:nitrite reductase (NADH) small subunit
MTEATLEYKVGSLDAVPRGEGRVFAVGPMRLAVFRTHADRVFATQERCPHLGGPLADGLIDQGAVICPLHDRTYDLRSGAGLNTECSLQTYPARVGPDGVIVVSLEPMTR